MEANYLKKYFSAVVRRMFGENLKRIRAEKCMTQIKVATLAGIHKRYYQSMEAGSKHPSILIAARLQKAFECEWTDLTRGL